MVKKYLKGIARIFLYLLAIFLLSFHLFAFTLNFSKVNSLFIEKIFAGKLTYDNISFRQNFHIPTHRNLFIINQPYS